MFAYRLYGLRVDAAFELPELTPCTDKTVANVIVTLGQRTDVGADFLNVVVNGDVVLTVPGVARFTMSNGARIVIEPDQRSSARDIRLYLLGSALGATLHQRMLLPIHSNAVIIDGGAVAFIGRSGSGKSTLATWFHDRGHAILSDDVCVLGKDEAGRVIAHRGVPRIRLWRDSLEASGRKTTDHQPVADFADKYALHTGNAAVAESAIMRAFFLLSDDHSTGGDATIACVAGGEAARALMENTYRGTYVRSLGMARSHFDQCADIARIVPMFCVRRPWDLTALDAVTTQLVAQVKSVIGNADQ